MLSKLRQFLFQTYFRLSRPMTLGVRIIATNKENHVFLVRHTYIEGWHLPGGGVEKGENVHQAAIKELKEEAGLVTDFANLELISIHANSKNFKGDHVILFRTQKYTKIEVNNRHEIAESGFFDIQKLPSGTTRATLERIAEVFANQETSHFW